MAKATQGKGKSKATQLTEAIQQREQLIRDAVINGLSEIFSEHEEEIREIRDQAYNEGRIVVNFEVAIDCPEAISKGAKVDLAIKYDDKRRFVHKLNKVIDDPTQGQFNY